jgi:hypothetical protein
MKRRTFYHLSLLLPLVVLIVSLGITFLRGGFGIFTSRVLALDSLRNVAIFLILSAFFWGPLYIWMVVVMLIWGRGRSTAEVRRLYLLSPFLLASSMGYPAVLTAPAIALQFLLDGFLRINNLSYVAARFFRGLDQGEVSVVGSFWFAMAVLCVVVGYAFVGIGLWMERFMARQGWFNEEFASQSEHST